MSEVGPGKPPVEHQFKPGQSGNPAGKPKGSKHLSTWIQELGEDEEFEVYLQHPTKGYVEYKGAPVKAVVQTAWQKAAAGDKDAREWLAKHGWKQQVDITTKGESIAPTAAPELVAKFTEFLKEETKSGNTD